MNNVSINVNTSSEIFEILFISADENDGEYEEFRIRNKRAAINSEEDKHSSSGICATNPCEHGGICLPNRRMKYHCKCIDGYHGEHCEKRKQKTFFNEFVFFVSDFLGLTKRSISKYQSLEELYDHFKRASAKKAGNSKNKNDGRVYYDYLNGIYFRK